MNKGPTLRLLRQRLFNISEPSANCIRAERLHNGKPVSVYYFDFTESVAEPTFDLNKYSQDRIASDFYNSKGSLQWNYYLYFVLPDSAFAKLQGTPRIADIERERTFTRKFVRGQEAVNVELAEPLAAIIHTHPSSPDVTSRWIEALREANLDRVSNPKADYASTVRDYLSGVEATKEEGAPSNGVIEAGQFLKTLHFTRYRSYPKERTLEFGTVNLFRGVNGTGKTSILEAIELCICGGNRRQDGRRDRDALLQVQFAGKSQIERCPMNDSASYRALDLAWYGGYYRQGNHLHLNFGRFNFFDTDAAFQFSSFKNGIGIVDSLNALLLGDFATTIEERMKQFLERFSREESESRRLLQIRRHEMASASEQNVMLVAIKDTREALLGELGTKAENCGWRRLPARLTLDALAVLQETVDETAVSVEHHVETLAWLGRISLSSLKRERLRIAQALEVISRQQVLARSTNRELDRIVTSLAASKVRVTVLSRLDEYHAEADAFFLLGKKAQLEEQQARVARLKEASHALRGVDFDEFAQVTVPIEAFRIQRNREIASNRRALDKLRARADELRGQIGALATMIQEIKGLGHRYCEVTPDATDCPLCGAQYEKLSEHLDSRAIALAANTSLKTMVTQIARSTAELKECQNSTNRLIQFERSARILLPSEQVATQPTKSIAKSIKALVEGVAHETGKLAELLSQVERFELAGFNERELQELLDQAHSVLSVPRSRLTKKDVIADLFSEATALVVNLQREEREARKREKEITVALKSLVTRFVDTEELGDGIVELQRRSALIQDILASLTTLQKPVEIADSVELSAVASKLKAFGASVGRIQKALKAIEERDALEGIVQKNLAEATAAINRLEPQHTRAKEAVSVLNKLLGSEYKSNYLEKFLAEHNDKISSIFSRIHSPHEFKNVSITDTIKLVRHSERNSTVSEISTGQRAALALSVFLALNSSIATKAPWMLFDDPVVHVDDLNVLSFMDMLRELALLGQRQIFFATANSRIGDLFAKKFDCLGSSFREFRLER